MTGHSFELKALVDKANERIIYVESGGDLVDVLLSILTMPVGNIIRLICNPAPKTTIGCMNNLYASVENLDVRFLRSKECREMLLRPQNAAETYFEDLKLKIDDSEPLKYFYCGNFNCLIYGKNLSQCKDALCNICRRAMSIDTNLTVKSFFLSGSAFVNELALFLISDELEVKPPSTATSFSLISKLGTMNTNSFEERILNIGVDEVFKLVKSSLVSKFPLTETLLRPSKLSEVGSRRTFYQVDSDSDIKYKVIGNTSNENGKICVKLLVSKSKKRVCYAEVDKDFVDLLFSFLTIPLGHIMKEMHVATSKGSIHHLYDSIRDLDSEKYFKSTGHKEIILSPKIASGFSYENQPLVLEEDAHPQFYCTHSNYSSTLTFSRYEYNSTIALKVKDLKSSGGGFMMGPRMFTVTDDLMVTPISPVSCLLVLDKLNVSLSDVEERIVHVGNEEASRLLVASFISDDSALTDTFL